MAVSLLPYGVDHTAVDGAVVGATLSTRRWYAVSRVGGKPRTGGFGRLPRPPALVQTETREGAMVWKNVLSLDE